MYLSHIDVYISLPLPLSLKSMFKKERIKEKEKEQLLADEEASIWK